jgi:hypothetical protein
MKKNIMQKQQTSLILFAFILFLSCFSGCIEEDKVINAELNQYSRSVPTVPVFNGATCLVCIDVHSIGGTENMNWLLSANGNPAFPQWNPAAIETAMVNEITTKISACPAGANVKIQFLYHEDTKQLYHRDGNIIKNNFDWNQYQSVENVLRHFGQAGNSRISKVYLTSCESQLRTSTVDAAFSLPAVTHVVTVDDIIELQCGTIAGAGYVNHQPTFRPNPVNIIVWEKEGNKQIAKIPEKKVSEKQKFDINTNSVVNR